MYGQYTVPPATEMVKFGVGQPSPATLPLDLVKEDGLGYINGITNRSLLQYGDIPGYKAFRNSLSEFLSKGYKHEVDPSHLFVTNGVTDAITFFATMIAYRKPIVYVEEPTYFLALNIFKDDFKFKTQTVPIYSDGIDVDKLEEHLASQPEDQLQVLYTVPTFHNPTSYTMSHEKRLKLAELTKKYENFVIVADEVYQLLYFSEEHTPPLPLCYYTDKAISLGSFSKILAPSLRLGWMQIRNKELMELFTKSGQMDSSGGKSPFVQAVVHGIILNGGLQANIEKCQTFLRENCAALSDLVREKLSDHVEFIQPDGGYFLWLKLKNLRAHNLVKIATEHKLQFLPGTRFSACGGCNDYIRLSFSYYDPDGFETGVDRLIKLFEHAMVEEQKRFENSVKVILSGHNGRLGSRIKNLISNDDNFSFRVGLDRSTMPTFLRDVQSGSFEQKSKDVVIDVSSPEATTTLLKCFLENGVSIPVVIGTTGDTMPDQLIKEYSKVAPVALISNFSKGIPQFLELLENVDEGLWDLSMVEKHHVHKVDKPSGTAKTLALALASDIPIESVREGEIFGVHSVILDSEMEKITITHEAKSRDLFAEGAIRYAKWLVEQKSGFYDSMYTNKSTMDGVSFAKYTGCGNDFVIFNAEELADSNASVDVAKLCKRGKSVGADGVIVVDTEFLKWHYYNSDGKSVEMCGNGARCVVQYLLDHDHVEQKDFTLTNNFDIKTNVSFESDGTFFVHLPDVDLDGADYGFSSTSIEKPDGAMSVDFYTVGVPHLCVMFPPEVDLPDPTAFGEDLRTKGHDVNVNFWKLNDKTGNLEVRTYERGVYAETLACGTGCTACAVAFNRYKIGELESNVYHIKTVSDDILLVKFDYDTRRNIANVALSGPAERVFEGVL